MKIKAATARVNVLEWVIFGRSYHFFVARRTAKKEEAEAHDLQELCDEMD
jgi:hypothetical protein